MKRIFLILLLLTAISQTKAQTHVQDSLAGKLEDTKKDSYDDVVTFCEQMPEFNGGNEMMAKFVNDNLNYPIEARKNKVEGRVVLQFIVNRDGSLSNIEVIKPLAFGCDEEAERIITLMPKWVPGRQNGKIVRVMYTLPMVFRLK